VALSSGPLGAVALRLVSPVLIVVFAAACGTAMPATARPSAQPSTPAAVSRPWSVVPEPDRAKYLAALAAIDSRLAAAEERALRRAVNVCYRAYEKKSDAAVRAYAEREYSSGPVEVSPRQARKIVAAVKKWICACRGLHTRWQA
jgi:hypothetical protein